MGSARLAHAFGSEWKPIDGKPSKRMGSARLAHDIVSAWKPIDNHPGGEGRAQGEAAALRYKILNVVKFPCLKYFNRNFSTETFSTETFLRKYSRGKFSMEFLRRMSVYWQLFVARECPFTGNCPLLANVCLLVTDMYEC